MIRVARRMSLLVLVALTYQLSLGQARLRKLPPNINQLSINFYAPFVSGDGQSMIYLSDYTDDGHHTMYYATKSGVSTWHDGKEVNKLINRPTLNYRGGYCLSFDGDMLIFTSRKSGLGGFELWYSYRRGNDWEAPKNFGAPINSASNEGGPALSPDGEYLYYMRCDQMSEYKGASGCEIVVSKRRGSKWTEPEPLPANINTGNSQTPRMLADGETMIFASDQMGGKGGLDLFMTRKTAAGWSDPIPMDFINTEKDDQFVSIPAKGRYAYLAMPGARSSELVQVLLPDEFQPKKVMRIQGVVTDKNTGAPVDAELTVFSVEDRNRLYNDRIGPSGEFAIVLNEGQIYDLAVSHPDPAYVYFSKIYELQEVGRRDKESLKIELVPLAGTTTFPSDIRFKDYSAAIADNATFELRRLAELLRRNPSLAIEILVHQQDYRSDSIASDPDLTEVRTDSVWTMMERARMVTITDTLALEAEDSEDLADLNEDGEDIDESGDYKLMKRDSLVYEQVEMLELKYTYHNDRTEQQARAIKEYLVGRGVDEERIATRGIKSSSHKDEQVEGEKGQSITVQIKIL